MHHLQDSRLRSRHMRQGTQEGLKFRHLPGFQSWSHHRYLMAREGEGVLKPPTGGYAHPHHHPPIQCRLHFDEYSFSSGHTPQTQEPK
jgi:hypothetical protein